MNDPPSVIPAQLSFLTIYNPSLGTTDETLAEQIVFYSSRASQSRRVRSAHRDSTVKDQKDEKNERLRQVGLAQGMVSFAKWVLITSIDETGSGRSSNSLPGTFRTEKLWTQSRPRNRGLCCMNWSLVGGF